MPFSVSGSQADIPVSRRSLLTRQGSARGAAKRSTLMKTPGAPQTYALRSLADVSELMRQRQISPVELVAICLDRIERLQPSLNAFITVTGESALQAAKIDEGEIQQGRWKGPLNSI